MVHRGHFSLFSEDPLAPETKQMTYDFDMTSINCETLHFHGFKIIDASVTLDLVALWKSTTTLYSTVSRPDGHVLGRGILHVQLEDFVAERNSVTPDGRNLLSKARSVVSFMDYFAKQSASIFFAPFMKMEYPAASYGDVINPTQPTQTIRVEAEDGVTSYLYMWEATVEDPELTIHNLYMIPGASVDHRIFSLETIEHNAVQYFLAAGYRVWVIVHRIGIDMKAEDHWTTFDARLDIKAGLQHIRNSPLGGPVPIYTIAHCMGSVAFSSGLLDGTIPTSWILGISCSQVFMNPKWALVNMLKVKVPIPLDTIYKLVIGNWLDITSDENDTVIQQLINQMLRLYPVEPEEICRSVSCHRTSFVFGRQVTNKPKQHLKLASILIITLQIMESSQPQ